MIIDASRAPRLQIGEAEPFAIESCEVLRDVASSTLTNIVQAAGPIALPVGARITLWAGPNMVFVGTAVDPERVLDLLSAATDEALRDDEVI